MFNRSADGRVIKILTIVDDATHESVAVVPERAIGGACVTRILDALAARCGLPQVIRTDSGKKFCGRAMLTRAHQHGVSLRLNEPGEPNQNAYIESFNGRLRDECLGFSRVEMEGDLSMDPRFHRLVYDAAQFGKSHATTLDQKKRIAGKCKSLKPPRIMSAGMGSRSTQSTSSQQVRALHKKR